ncbi:hypothetical protein [Microbacterium foliorum]|uniref:hypothetical protein n=1 Tax=Microbacterium foliorum TaxID=104336 RepID=UPI00373646D3
MFFLPFYGGLLLAVAAFADAMQTATGSDGPAITLAVAGLAMTLAGVIREAVAGASVWIWQDAPWGVEMRVWRRWRIARRWLSALTLLIFLSVGLSADL